MLKTLQSLVLLITFLNISFAEKLEDVSISIFEDPYSEIHIYIDGVDVKFEITEDTKFKGKKTKNPSKDMFYIGATIDLDYEIVKRKRIAKKLTLKSELTPGKEKFSGVYELYEDDIAYVDGRKLILSDDAELKCKGKKSCGCTKGMSYINWDELTEGDVVEIKGHSNENGIITAEKVVVCSNIYTETDQLLRQSVENSYDATGTRVVATPTGIIVPPNSLYQGKIKIGSLNYQLVNDIKLQGYINMVGNRILPDYAKTESYQNNNEIYFRFYVINDPVPNAFAFPNGMVFIHTGLLKIMENEAQLATVLGHEVAHVTYEHSSDRYDKKAYMDSPLIQGATTSMLDKIGLNKKSTNTGDFSKDMLGSISNAMLSTKPSDLVNLFTKSNESQADRVGLMYMYLAGYDLRESSKFWKNMADINKDQAYQNKMKSDVSSLIMNNKMSFDGDYLSSMTEQATSSVIGNFLETIYSSHPLTKQRIGDINALLRVVYKDEDFEGWEKGESDFNKYVK